MFVHALSSHFLKENLFCGGSGAGFAGFFGPKGVFGCQDNVQQVSEGLLVVLTTPSNLLSGNGATPSIHPVLRLGDQVI